MRASKPWKFGRISAPETLRSTDPVRFQSADRPITKIEKHSTEKQSVWQTLAGKGESPGDSIPVGHQIRNRGCLTEPGAIHHMAGEVPFDKVIPEEQHGAKRDRKHADATPEQRALAHRSPRSPARSNEPNERIDGTQIPT
jgi:hypothetical protein